MSDALSVARELARRGFKVLPVNSNKVPVLKEWSKRASDSDQYVVNTFSHHKGGVGILTGLRGRLVVVDIDNKDGKALERLQSLVEEGWPRTFIARTRSGGFHLYYRPRGAKLKTCAGWREQIDVRAEGGQVVCYQVPDPEQIADLPGEFALKLSQADVRSTTHDARDDLDLAGEGFELPQAIPSGARNDTLYRYACSLLARGTKGGYVMRELKKANLERCAKPVPQRELDLILESSTSWWATQEQEEDDEPDRPAAEPQGDSAAGLDEEDPLAKLQRRYVFVMQDNVVYDLWARKFIPLEGFKNAHTAPFDIRPKKKKRRGNTMTLATAWLQHPDTVKVPYIDYEPGEGQVFERDGDNILNLWVPPALVPKKGDVSPFTDHLMYLFDGDRGSAKHFLHWLAYVVQHPGKRVGHACLIVGGQGTGKSVIANVLRRMLGDHNVSLVSNAILQSAYNEWMEHTQIAVAEEFRMSGRWNMMNELKALVSEEKVVINAKYRRPYNCDNHTNFLLFSNFDDAAHLEHDDRRYWVFVSRAKKRDFDYYTRLWTWARGDGPAALLHLLKGLDLSGFERDRWSPPATKSKQAMVEASKGDVEAWLDAALEDRAYPFESDLVTEQSLRDAIGSEHGPSEKVWARRWLRKRASQVPVTRSGEDKLVRLWAVRDPDRWAGASGPERISEWHKGLSLGG